MWLRLTALGTGGVSSWALKLARASGLKVILTSSSDGKLDKMKKLFGEPEIMTVNYSKTPEWHEEVLRLTDGVGVDLVIENGGASSLVKSTRCTRRGGIVSQVGYLGKQQADDLQELVPTIIDRRVILRYVSSPHCFWCASQESPVDTDGRSRGINAGPPEDMEDLCAALEATKMQFDDIIDKVYPFDQAEEAVQSLWEGKVVGKVVLRL